MSERTVLLGDYPSRVVAELAATRLRAEGIEVTVVADDVGGTYPALARVRLRVAADDEARARAIGSAPSAVADEAPGDVAEAERAVQGMGRRESRGWPTWLPAALVLLGVGYVLASVLGSEGEHPIDVATEDRNRDGRPDNWYHYEDGVIVRSEHDRKGDGRADETYRYDGTFVASAERDDDFDGAADTWVEYGYGVTREARQDLDRDGVADLTYEYRHGVLVGERLHPGGGAVERISVYEAGAPREVYRVDADGRRSLLRRYDEQGREHPAP